VQQPCFEAAYFAESVNIAQEKKFAKQQNFAQSGHTAGN